MTLNTPNPLFPYIISSVITYVDTENEIVLFNKPERYSLWFRSLFSSDVILRHFELESQMRIADERPFKICFCSRP